MVITNENEIKGVTKILSYLNENDINELVLTVTNRLIKEFKSTEATGLILNYSESALHFLKKKKIKKELIFRYLNDEQFYVSPNLTKSNLIRECLTYWKSSQTFESMEIDESDSEPEEVVVAQDYLSAESTSITIDDVKPFSNNQVCLPNDQIYVPESNLVTATVQPNQFNQVNFNQQDNQLMELGLKFGEWFYSNLRELTFNANDFYSDSQLGIQFVYNEKSMSFSETGNQRIMNMLKNFNLCNLRLKPNLLPQHGGISVHLEPHGLLKIKILGILHFGSNEDNPYGWFEDVFGLCSDSTLHENNWRIKFYNSTLTLSKPLSSIDQFISSYKMLNNC